eukprot:scaffold1106_cov23-Tisochrysis_lutea.AAC.1
MQSDLRRETRVRQDHKLSSPTAVHTSRSASGVWLLKPRQMIMGRMHPAWPAASIMRRAQIVSRGSSRLPMSTEVE